MIQNYKVKTIVTSSGERLPLMLGRDGLPIFEPTAFSLTEVRSRNRASNTIDSYLRSIMVFLLFLDLRGINLQERLNVGELLSLGEVEDLVGICRLPVEKINCMLGEAQIETKKAFPKTLSLDKFRKSSSIKKDISIAPCTVATRLRNIRGYLNWLCTVRTSKSGIDLTLKISLESSLQYASNAIEARLPYGSNSSIREGLSPEVVSEILKVVNHQSKENPWFDEHSRYRNELIVLWLLNLGLRRGELLNIRISDLNFRAETVNVVRRADDVKDQRANQPKVKTKGRQVPISSGLLDKTNVYIMNHRSAKRDARKHDFLFVSSDAGAPLSIPSLNKIFAVLKNKFPEIAEQLFPHILRHTWNDNFSEEMDRNKVNEVNEQKLRSYLMGWSETSGTAATYTKRHVRRKAREASLAMQEAMFSKKEKND